MYRSAYVIAIELNYSAKIYAIGIYLSSKL